MRLMAFDLKLSIRRVAAISLVALAAAGTAQTSPRVMLGAQIWIEPGQSPAEVDDWFRQLSVSGMPVARVFLVWSYMQTAPGTWNFALYDSVFRAAEKYHVRIVATLTPNGPPPFLGGDGNQGVGLLPTQKSKQLAAVYLRTVVERYRASPALDTWLLVNEPGQAPVATPNAERAFRVRLAEQYRTPEEMNKAWGASFSSFDAVTAPKLDSHGWNHNAELDWRTFWQGFQTSELKWLADRVRESDSKHPLHLNPAGLLQNLAGESDDLPAWRNFLDSLGCSIHPAWHFGLLERDRYALGVSYVNDLVRGSSEPNPYWVTELQGGNNIYSSTRPMEPSADDIAQWVWTSLAGGADRVIFWLLNARKEGVEAGEWSLLDFQQQPSRRLTTSSAIAREVTAHQDFFDRAKPELSPVTIVLSLETMTLEEAYHHDDDPARGVDAHVLEALGFYEALSQTGPPPNIKYFQDFDWTAKTTPRIAILPDARELTAEQIIELHQFVQRGNILLISGLTGFYGPHAKAWPLAGFPLGDVTGGVLKEVHLQDTTNSIKLTSPTATLPTRLWTSSIGLHGATSMGESDGEVTATERITANGGRVIWIPSPVGLGAWMSGSRPLARYLQASLRDVLKATSFSMPDPTPGCLLRTLRNDKQYVTVMTNGAATAKQCELTFPAGLNSSSLWGDPPKVRGRQAVFDLGPRATSVQLWGVVR